MRYFIVIFFLAFLTACGHSQLQYSPNPSNMSWERAVKVIEQGFYEDYGREKPQAVAVTQDAIILADGTITNTVGYGAATPVDRGAFVIGASTSKTVDAGQRIYLRSLGDSMLMQKNGRDSRYAVVIRLSEGVTARRIFFRSEQRAQEFLDALEYLKVSAY